MTAAPSVMSDRISTTFLFVLCVIVFFPAAFCGEPIQIYLHARGEATARQPLSVEVCVLDESGNVVKDFEGEKKVVLSLSGPAGAALPADLPSALQFREGKAIFELRYDRQEQVVLYADVEGIHTFIPLTLDFTDNDTTAPEIATIMLENHELVVLSFNEPLELESASDPGNYTVVTDKDRLHPAKVEFHDDYVVLSLSRGLEENEEAYIEAEGIKDLAGNEIESGLRSATVKGCGC